MTDNLPTSEQLGTFSRQFNKVTRKHPYITAFSEMSWDERVETMTQISKLERERELLASDARRYGYRRGFAPELSLRADKLVNQMEDLIPDSTGGTNNNWSKIEFLRMDGNELRWHKWYKCEDAVSRSATVMFCKPYDAQHQDAEPLSLDEVKADTLHQISLAQRFIQYQNNDETEKLAQMRANHAHLTDAQWTDLLKQSVSMAEHISEFLEYIRCWKVCKVLNWMKPDELLFVETNRAIEMFLEAAEKDNKLLLGIAVFHKHLITINPDFLDHTKTNVLMERPIALVQARAVPLGEYFRPHVRPDHYQMLVADKEVGKLIAPFRGGFARTGDFSKDRERLLARTYRR
jgi:hypothetical protein